jgi:hypothetical protein
MGLPVHFLAILYMNTDPSTPSQRHTWVVSDLETTEQQYVHYILLLPTPLVTSIISSVLPVLA